MSRMYIHGLSDPDQAFDLAVLKNLKGEIVTLRAVDQNGCTGCAFDTGEVLGVNCSRAPACGSVRRGDGRNIIWVVKNESEASNSKSEASNSKSEASNSTSEASNSKVIDQVPPGRVAFDFIDGKFVETFRGVVTFEISPFDAPLTFLQGVASWNDPNGDFEDLTRTQMLEILLRDFIVNRKA